MDPFPGRQCVFLGITHGIDPSEDIADVILKVAYNTSAENSAEEGRLRPCGEEENRAAPTALVAVCSLCTGYPRIHPLRKAGCTEGVVMMRTPVGSPTTVSGANGDQARWWTYGLHESEEMQRVQGTNGV